MNSVTTLLKEADCWQAVQQRDSNMDGRFFYGVVTTGVYCRPSCPSRRPLRDNVQFFTQTQDAEHAGLRPCLRCHPLKADPQRAKMVEACRHIEANLDQPLTLRNLSEQAGLSPFHFQRQFKAIVGVSPREYADACRLKALKGELQNGASVTDAMLEAGYGSTSRLYERTGPQLGMTPTAYRKGGEGATIRHAVANTPLGLLLVAATNLGICAIQFGDSEKELEEQLRAEYPLAELRSEADELRPWITAIERHLTGEEKQLNLPLDIRATVFQRRVWEHLQSIPYGETRSYGQVASALGQPTAMRAVARACASNPVALAVPCHRVVREGGNLAGYRWGLKRKEALLSQEKRSE